MSIYLDHNATTPLDPRVLEAMQPWFAGAHGNPASVHKPGRAAHEALEQARAEVAALVDAKPAEVVFTGGGTEADNLALKGICAGTPDGKLLVGAIEHSAVLGPADALARLSWDVQRLPVDREGRYDLVALDKALAKKDVKLVSTMRANNETGVIEDVAAIAKRVHGAGALLHCDAIQAAGKISIDFRATGADLMTLSAHKLNGPRGIGALVMDRRVDLTPLVHGGGQEQGLRGGTENLAGIVGLGKAAALAKAELAQRATHSKGLRDALEIEVRKLPGVRVFSAGAERLPNTLQFGLEGIDGEWLVMELDKHGIAVSSGSACHSGSGEPSHVLTAMGYEPAIAKGALRVSFGLGNTQADVATITKALHQIVASRPSSVAAVGW